MTAATSIATTARVPQEERSRTTRLLLTRLDETADLAADGSTP